MFGRYLLRRLLWTLITLFGVSLLTFILVFAGPTDPARALVGEKATGVSIEHIRQQYGLDRPLPVQYLSYIGKVLRGDLGESYYFRRPVSEALLGRLPATALLAFSIMLVSCLIGIPLGVITALRQGSLLDRATMVTGLVAFLLVCYCSISLPTRSSGFRPVGMAPSAISFCRHWRWPFRGAHGTRSFCARICWMPFRQTMYEPPMPKA